MTTNPDSTRITEETRHNIALPWHQGGCSVIPIRPGGRKAPYFEWEGFQRAQPSSDDVRLWFEGQYPQAGVAVICGKVSGNLELVELEGRAADGDSLTRIKAQCELRGVEGIWDSLMAQGYTEWSPSGGIHILYRVPEHDIPGNTKIAMRPANNDELSPEELKIIGQFPERKFWRVLAETRGEGGYVIVAPTGGNCHSSGEPWITISGRQGVFQHITWSQRMAIHSAISAALDQRSELPTTATYQPPKPKLSNGHVSPGDDFNERASWEDSWFTGQGWQITQRLRDGEIFWTRPGKDPRDGHSASTGYRGDADCLYIWSSSTELPIETPLNKFFIYAHYHFSGDMSAAAKSLLDQGYGTDSKSQGIELLKALDFGKLDLDSDDATVAIPPHGGFDLTDTGSGRRMKGLFGDQFRYNTTENKWYVWHGHAWELDETLEIQRAAERNAELVLMMISQQVKATEGTDEAKEARRKYGEAKSGMNHGKLLNSISRFAAQPDIAVIAERFNCKMDLLNLPNGTLNLVTGTLQPHDPDDMITLTFGAEYRPEADYPKWTAFLIDVFPDRNVREYVQRALGYSLLGNPTERAMFLLHGPSGTGKSVLTRVMTEVFGDYGITAPATTFRLKKNDTSVDVHRLRGRRFVTTSEMPEGALLDEELVKRITGGDSITSRSLYEAYQDWRAQCVIWIATNFLPRVNGDDNAIWRRAKSIPMLTEFGTGDKEEILGYADHLLVERDGILNWLLEGLACYQQQGLNQPPEITADIESYRIDVDSVASFIRDKVDDGVLIRSTAGIIRSSVLNGLYTQYCDENRVPPLGARRFANRLRALGTDIRPTKIGGAAVWMGLEYVPDALTSGHWTK
jgi:putative DNA primase/helicase